MPESAPRVESDTDLFNPQRPGWQALSACHPQVIPHIWQEFDDCKVPVDLFFPEGVPTKARREAIASICGACPVREDCWEHGVLHETYGWYGGQPAIELERERKRRGIRGVDTPEIDPRTRKVIGTFIEEGHGTPARAQQHRRDGEVPCERCREAAAWYSQEINAVKYREWMETATEEEKDAARTANRLRRAQARKTQRAGRRA